MSWEDVFFSRNMSSQDIIRALAQVFEIEEDTIVIEYGWGWHAGLDDDRIQILCRLDIVRGDYPIRLQVALWREALIPLESERYNVLGRLCDRLNTPAIVSSELENPYISTLIHGEGNYQYIYLSSDSDEFEVTDELYRFTRQLSPLEIQLGNLIVCNYLDVEWSAHDSFMHLINTDSSKEDLRTILRNIRLEAQRAGREGIIDAAIAYLETRSQSDPAT